MTRILHILSQIPAQTGSGIFFQNVVRQCSDKGHAQSAIIGLPKALSGYPINGIPSEASYEVLFDTEALPFKIPGMSDVMPYDSTIFSQMPPENVEAYQRQFRAIFEKAVLEFQPDVILSHHLWLSTATVCKALGEIIPDDAMTSHTLPSRPKPLIFAVCHGTDLRQLELAPHLAPIVLEGCRNLDGVFTLSHLQSRLVCDRYGLAQSHVHLVGGGYDASVFHRDAPLLSPLMPSSDVHPLKNGHKKIELVYAGKLAQSKGLFELIRSMSMLDANLFRLRIAGNGSGHEAEDILSAISTSAADITYVGQLSQNELASLFRSSDVFILPSYYEGLSLVTLEALACGMRAVVNSLEGLHDWLGDVVNASGRVVYVDMPKLIGPDRCAPEAEDAYVERLATAIRRCAEPLIYDLNHPDEPGLGYPDNGSLNAYYMAIEEKSWAGVFGRMEAVFNRNGESF